MNKYLTILCILCIYVSVNAQHEKIIHNSFEINDASKITLNIYGEHTFEKWPGNNILTETTVKLHDASPAVFKHYLKEGRYEIIGKIDDNALNISSVKMVRNPIKTSKGVCYEFVNTVVYYPEDYTVSGTDSLVKSQVSASLPAEKNTEVIEN